MSHSTMAENPINATREAIREKVFLNRRKYRDEETDVWHCLENLSISARYVTIICNKLPTQSVSSLDLKLLQKALINNPQNGEILLNNARAFQGLMVNFTGFNPKKQLASGGCLCNLALGDQRTCYILGKFAGAYVIATLDLTMQLAVTCAWTLGNIASSSKEVCEIIVAQGAIAKLCDVMNRSSVMEEAAVYALSNIAHQQKDDLRLQHLAKIINHISRIELTPETSQLFFILSCHKDFVPQIFPIPSLNRILYAFTMNMEKHLNVCRNATTVNDSDIACCSVFFLARILANLNDIVVFKIILTYIVNYNLVDNLSRLLDVDRDGSVCYLLGNMMNVCGDYAFVTRDWLALKVRYLYIRNQQRQAELVAALERDQNAPEG